MAESVVPRRVVRDGPEGRSEEVDAVSVEEPLSIQVDGDTLAVTMRTPGADRELAVGFLLAEGIVEGLDELGGIAVCGRPGDPGYGNTLQVTSAPGKPIVPERRLEAHRFSVTTSACGVCGRRSVEELRARLAPLPPGPTVAAAAIARAVEGLRALQPGFARTGGLHAAAACAEAGAPLVAFEDVGRHNAVDKVLGALLLRPAAARPSILAVSGRASFEIVQKAAAGRIPIVASVSAATSLAVDTAEALGVTLCAFVRGESLAVYAGAARVA